MDTSLYIIFSLLLYNSLGKRHAAIAERAHGKETWRRSGVLKNLRVKVYGVSPPWRDRTVNNVAWRLVA